ncbi:GHKL domain-containing protein [Chitinophaga niastensis]|uniref:GHKL domain-containing protein n=1 Tax=Chitinophaga niastensis TaxID=536980 RepID=A0A2P8HGP2_CHINA|nr:histidine kinase [Chitinophaga niastensis]PSL45386.1 GHKL domain-containing protein [Chitinophaga niastensis]
MSLFSRYKLDHFLFWIIYFIFWTGFSIYNYGTPLLWALSITTIWLIGQAATAYISAYFLMPVFLYAKRYILFILFFLATIAAGAIFIAACAVPMIRYVTSAFTYTFSTLFPYVLMANVYISFIFIAIRAIKHKILEERKNKLFEKERTENELRFLKSQLNPHFLFNAINSIYILIKTDPEVAGSTLAKFADMLRYQLYECNTDKISIEKEVAYLNNYIEVEKLRKGNTVITHYTVEEQVQHFPIAPLLIIPFVENAYKHISAFTDKPNKININLKYEDPFFEFRIENTIDKNATTNNYQTYGGIGLENVKRRLELIYSDRHTLQMNITDNIYMVLLRISIQ